MTDKWAARTFYIETDLTRDEIARLTAAAAQRGLTLEEYMRTLLGFPA